MRVIEDSREFVKNAGGPLQAQEMATDMYAKSKIDKYEMYWKMIKPGNLYTFKYYNSKAPYDLIDSKIPFIDLHPFGIVLSMDNDELRMLNLNVIPLKARERLLMLMEKFFRGKIQTNAGNERTQTWRVIPITEELIKKHIPYDFSIAVSIYKTKFLRKVFGLDWSNLNVLMSLSFEKTLFFNRMNRISNRSIARKILLNKRKELMIK